VTVRYRAATVADVPAMARSRLADPAAGRADERMAAYLEGKHHPQQALGPRVAFVALDAEGVVGYIAGHLTRRHQYDGEVQYLFVAPRHRGTGVAARLLRLQAGWFIRRQARRICVNVDPDNAVARAFYTRLGATELNRFWFVWSDVGILEAGAGPGDPGRDSS
jgi:GNAT superfamily N-acetyltransferase